MVITWSLIAGVCGGLIVLWQTVKMVLEMISPAINLKDTVDKHNTEIEYLKKSIQQIDKRMEHSNHMNTMQLRSMIDIMNHMIDGNHVDNMKSTRDDILNLISKNVEN